MAAKRKTRVGAPALVAAIFIGAIAAGTDARALATTAATENSPLGFARNSGAALARAERPQAPTTPLENALAYGDLASDNPYATRGVGLTKLFRAVSPGEFKQLMKTGKFAAGPNSLGGKFFAETAEHAGKWGEAMMGKGNFRIIQADLPTSAADKLMRWERLDGIGPARYGELDQLVDSVVRAFK
jgi:hypothetical protein